VKQGASNPWARKACFAAALGVGPDRLLTQLSCLGASVSSQTSYDLDYSSLYSSLVGSCAWANGGCSLTTQAFVDLMYSSLSEVGSSVYPSDSGALISTYWSPVVQWTGFTSSSAVPYTNLKDYLKYYKSASSGNAASCPDLSNLGWVNALVKGCMSAGESTNPWKHPVCFAAATVVGPNNLVNQFKCQGKAVNTLSSLGLDYTAVYAKAVGNCAWANGGCPLTSQNYIDLIYSALNSIQSTSWPSSVDTLRNTYWAPIATWTGFTQSNNVPYTNLQDWLRYYSAPVISASTSTASASTSTASASSIDSCDCLQTYTVVSGDYCDAIAAKFSLTLAELMEMNTAINPTCSNLAIGQVICVD